MSEMADVGVVIGAGFGALQMVAQFLMLFLPKNTVAFRVAKYVTSGPQRPPAE